ncbi:hypothetical protein D3C81_1258800 [compost metagenome]
MAGGVPAGAIITAHPSASKPGTPSSRTVGTCCSWGTRFAVVTASATALPDWISGMAAVTESTISGIWLPRKSACAGPLPLYGICTMNTPVCALSISADRCCVPPMPALA